MAWSWASIDWTATGTVTAAWVQAVGSVAAIVGATWIANRQSREARGREERDRAAEREVQRQEDGASYLSASRLVSIFSVKAEVLVSRMEEDAGESDRSHVGVPTRAAFRTALRKLETFPLATLRAPDAVVLFCNALETATLVVELLEELNQMCEKHPHAVPQLVSSKVPYLRQFADDLRSADTAIRDRAEPGWREKLAKVATPATS